VSNHCSLDIAAVHSAIYVKAPWAPPDGGYRRYTLLLYEWVFDYKQWSLFVCERSSRINWSMAGCFL